MKLPFIGSIGSDRRHSFNFKQTEKALKVSKITLYTFNFHLYYTCDKIHCNHCFQFCGSTNHLLEKNQYICRALSVLRHPDDRTDFFYLFNEIREKGLQGKQVEFRLKDNDENYQMYEVTGHTAGYDDSGDVNIIVGFIIDTNRQINFTDKTSENKKPIVKTSRLENIHLYSVMQHVHTVLQPSVPENVLFILDTCPDITIFIDLSCLEVVLTNLLIKAIHQTESGRISFGYQAISHHEVCIFITDTGAGLLNGAFPKGDNELSLCKKLIENMGGTVSVISTKGKGSTFSLVLPIHP